MIPGFFREAATLVLAPATQTAVGKLDHETFAVVLRVIAMRAWALDLDIRAYFDSIPHELLLRAVRKHTNCAWVLLYIERWLKAPVQLEDGTL